SDVISPLGLWEGMLAVQSSTSLNLAGGDKNILPPDSRGCQEFVMAENGIWMTKAGKERGHWSNSS
ncbi:hypothetical protein BgiBS90_005693, partial [Biomphalaria glabrata]